MGKIDIDELNDELELDLPTEEADSLGGLVMTKLERVPEERDQVTVDGVRMVVEEVDGLRINKVRLFISLEKRGETGTGGEGEH